MEPITLEKPLSELMGAHKVPCYIENEWVVPHGRLPAIRAVWYPGEQGGRLEVDVLLENEDIINECFAGVGSGNDALSDAFQNFCVNSYHVFLATFWDVVDDAQVLIESWSIGGKNYSAYIGNFGSRGNEEAIAEIPKNLFEAIEGAIKQESEMEKISWFRCFFCDVSGQQTFEALKNNQVWKGGLEALQKLAWKKSEGYYSVRNFIVLTENA